MANAEAKAEANWMILACIGTKLAKNANTKKVELPGLSVEPDWIHNMIMNIFLILFVF